MIEFNGVEDIEYFIKGCALEEDDLYEFIDSVRIGLGLAKGDNWVDELESIMLDLIYKVETETRLEMMKEDNS